MSDLRHKNLEELNEIKKYTIRRINRLGSQWAGERTRLEWIEKYISEKEQSNANT